MPLPFKVGDHVFLPDGRRGVVQAYHPSKGWRESYYTVRLSSALSETNPQLARVVSRRIMLFKRDWAATTRCTYRGAEQ